MIYICDDCDFYFEDNFICPKCGSKNVHEVRKEPKMIIEDDFIFIEELKFDD